MQRTGQHKVKNGADWRVLLQEAAATLQASQECIWRLSKVREARGGGWGSVFAVSSAVPEGFHKCLHLTQARAGLATGTGAAPAPHGMWDSVSLDAAAGPGSHPAREINTANCLPGLSPACPEPGTIGRFLTRPCRASCVFQASISKPCGRSKKHGNVFFPLTKQGCCRCHREDQC